MGQTKMDGEQLERVLEDVRAGRIESYGQVILAFQAQVRRVVGAMLRDPESTEDLVQQVFMDAYRRLGHFRAGSDFGLWISGFARRLVLAELRRRRRQSSLLSRYHRYLATKNEGEDAACEHANRRSEALMECREELPDSAAQALRLRYEGNRSFEEIAAEIGRKVSGTQQLLYRARVLLRACIEKRMARS